MTTREDGAPRSAPPITEQASAVPGFRFVRGRDVTFAAARTIVHADYAVKLTTRGRGAPIHYRGQDLPPCARGGVNIFAPFEPVSARRSAATTSFISLLVEPALLRQAATTLGCARRAHGDIACGDHRALAGELAALSLDLDAGMAPAELEARALSAVERLLGPDIEPKGGRVAVPPAVFTIRELILDRLTENVPMEQLERAAGFSRFHLVRLFRRHYRLPPHEFRIHARVAVARRLLAQGRSQSEVAAEVGFFDQSHLHRHFRRLVGISPGAFQHRLRGAVAN